MDKIKKLRNKSFAFYYFTDGLERILYFFWLLLAQLALILFAWIDNYPLFYYAAIVVGAIWILYVVGNYRALSWADSHKKWVKSKEGPSVDDPTFNMT